MVEESSASEHKPIERDGLARHGVSSSLSEDPGALSLLDKVIKREGEISELDDQIRALNHKKGELMATMKSDQTALESIDDERGEGRNFLKVVKGMENSGDRMKAIQPGDYIRMPWGNYRRWAGQSGENREALPQTGIAKVTVAEIKDKDRVVLDADGIRREVSASLFYNFGKTFIH